MDAQVEVGEAEWRELLSRTPAANPFQSPEMTRVYQGTRGYAPHVATVESQGQVKGLLASVLITYRDGNLTRFATRSLAQGGPIGDPSTFERLLSCLDSHASKRAIESEIRNIDVPTDPSPFVRSGYVWEDHLDFAIDLRPGSSAVWEGMSKSRRKGIDLAERRGLGLRELDATRLESAYALLGETYSRAKVPLADKSLFESALRVLGPSGHILALGAVHESELCAIRFVLCGYGVLHDWYAGSSDIGRSLHADEWLVWEALKRGVEKGYDCFRFGGAGRPGEAYGPGEFKRRFGGQRLDPGRFLKTYRPIVSTIAHAAYAVRRKLQ